MKDIMHGNTAVASEAKSSRTHQIETDIPILSTDNTKIQGVVLSHMVMTGDNAWSS